MTTKTPAETGSNPSTTDLEATDIFPLLANDRRRNVLHYLAGRTGSVPLGELAEQLALWESNPTYEQYERILTSLYHTHLPRLVSAELVNYEIEEKTVTGLSTIDAVRPYLDLALRDDHH